MHPWTRHSFLESRGRLSAKRTASFGKHRKGEASTHSLTCLQEGLRLHANRRSVSYTELLERVLKLLPRSQSIIVIDSMESELQRLLLRRIQVPPHLRRQWEF